MAVMDVKEAPAATARKSDRVSIAISVQISGADLSGNGFTDMVQTVNVSRNGCCLLTRQSLAPGQKIHLKRIGSSEEAVGRVVGQTGIRAEGNLYGLEVLNPSQDFWGIRFPRQKELEESAGRTLLRCAACLHTEEVALNEVELSVFQITHHLTRLCSACSVIGAWQAVPDPAGDGDVDHPASGKKSERRKHPRISMRAQACVGQPGPHADIVEVVNVSRSGICFCSSRTYNEDSWIQVAVPYTKGAANIFVAGRIVRARKISRTVTEYGVEYVRSQD